MSGPRIIVGVTGGISAYKTAELVSQLVQSGMLVNVVMTRAAQAFVGKATFAALSGRPVAQELFDSQLHPLGSHITLSEQSQLLCIAPASADFLSKAANGIADDLLSTLYLAFPGPVVMAPAMNSSMWSHPAVQRNTSQLKEDGVHLVGPDAGWLSCRSQGPGRMADPTTIASEIQRRLEAC
jgi:phosphopantothenoylcysteine decarboxylase/phosphopantothenate--cysteine ligase